MATKKTPAKKAAAVDADEGGSTQITLRIRKDLMDRMRLAADRKHLPLATWIKQSLQVALDEADAEIKKKWK